MSRRWPSGAVVVLLLMTLGRSAAAAPDQPRLFLDDTVRADWKRQAAVAGSPVARAIARCATVRRDPREFDREPYMGFDWSKHLQACLVAWVATGSADDARTALRYFTALLDDRDLVGDGLGGDQVVARDDGYPIRTFGVNAALAYDWLRGAPGMTEALRARARQRFAAWLAWYKEDGYRPHTPGTNYQAGYLAAATLIAIAQAGEAGARGDALWRYVTEELWQGDMARALAPGGILTGGDWGEGWQYAPLSVIEYALAARALTAQGIPVPGLREFLAGLLVRHVFALAPSGRTFAGGDTEDDNANLAVSPWTLEAVALGGADAESRAWALGELDRLDLDDADDFLLFAALARTGTGAPAVPPRASWPTWFLAAGTSNFYARTRWDARGVWTAMQCSATLDIDHFHPDAGNFVLSRGADDLIVDPSPYGTLSTLTSNAPTIESLRLPDEYRPGQGYWSERTGWQWAHQTAAGIAVARCDYADQFRFRQLAPDVDLALRDFVLVPSADGTDAALVVLDRARSGDPARDLYLRFRTGARWTAKADSGQATVGGSTVLVRRSLSSSGAFEVTASKLKDCFGSTVTRGNCDAARFPSSDLRLRIAGPEMSALHVVDVAGRGATPPAALLGGSAEVRTLWLDRGGRRAAVVWTPIRDAAAASLSYKVAAQPAVSHVVLDAPSQGGKATVAATRQGSDCAITITAGGTTPATPLTFTLDAACALTADPIMTGAAPLPAIGDTSPEAARAAKQHARPGGRTGCCRAEVDPGATLAELALTLLGLSWILRRRLAAAR